MLISISLANGLDFMRANTLTIEPLEHLSEPIFILWLNVFYLG